MKPDINKSKLYTSKLTSNSRSKSKEYELYYLFATKSSIKMSNKFDLCVRLFSMKIEKSLE